ncbi:hypothetical protein EDD86DRAFT_207545, partial [Gorgonomyces haynaldii]
MESLPPELLNCIASQLSFQDYLSLRSTCRYLSILPSVPQLKFYYYKQQTLLFEEKDGKFKYKRWKMDLDLQTFEPWMLDWLLIHKHGHQIKRIVQQRGHELSEGFKSSFMAKLYETSVDQWSNLDRFRFVKEERSFSPWKYMTNEEVRDLIYDCGRLRFQIGQLLSMDVESMHQLLFDEAVEYGFLEKAQEWFESRSVTISLSQLEKACVHGHLDLVQWLLKHTSLFRDTQNRCLLQACKGGHLQVLRRMLKEKLYQDSLSVVLLKSVEWGDPDVVKILVKDQRFKVQEHKKQIQRIANRFGHDEVLQCIKKVN